MGIRALLASVAAVDRHAGLKGLGIEEQAVALHRLHVPGTADEDHPMVCPGQHAAVVAADGAGAHHRNLHSLPPRRCCRPILVGTGPLLA